MTKTQQKSAVSEHFGRFAIFFQTFAIYGVFFVGALDAWGFGENWSLGGGIDFGASRFSSEVNGEISSRNGFHGDLRAVSQWGFENNLYAQLGAGWLWNRVSGVSSTEVRVTTTTQAAFLEFSPFWRWTDYSIGPNMRWTYAASNDLSFAESPDSNKQTAKWFWGLRLQYHLDRWIDEYDLGKWSVGFRYERDLNIQDRNLGLWLFDVTVLFDMNPQPRQQPMNHVSVLSSTQIKMVLDESWIRFDINQATLSLSSRTYLDQLADFLLKNSDRWKILEILGHSDSTGTSEFNKNLSEKRAEAVKSYLGSRGVPGARMSSVGLGSLKPLRTEFTDEDRSFNRRVDFLFSGLKDAHSFKDQLIGISKRMNSYE